MMIVNRKRANKDNLALNKIVPAEVNQDGSSNINDETADIPEQDHLARRLAMYFCDQIVQRQNRTLRGFYSEKGADLDLAR